MDDYFLRIVRCYIGRNLDSWRDRFKGVKRTKKRNILCIIVLILCMRLFFYALFEDRARAQVIDNMNPVSGEVIDPMSRVKDSEGIFADKKTICTGAEKMIEADQDKNMPDRLNEDIVRDMVKGYPIERMVPYIAKKDKAVAAFLIGIARKESGWGEHAPSYKGRDCYNYWGYKGNYNLVGGYSCFDSPEQAIDAVGERIGQLIGKKIDTPERMVVWKCGSSCAGHDPGGVKSWIGSVRQYWAKLLS